MEQGLQSSIGTKRFDNNYQCLNIVILLLWYY